MTRAVTVERKKRTDPQILVRQGSQSHIEAPGSLSGVLGHSGLGLVELRVSGGAARRTCTQVSNNQVGGWSLRRGIQGRWWQRWGMDGVGSQSQSLEISGFLRGLWGVSGCVSMAIALWVGLPGALCGKLGPAGTGVLLTAGSTRRAAQIRAWTCVCW